MNSSFYDELRTWKEGDEYNHKIWGIIYGDPIRGVDISLEVIDDFPGLYDGLIFEDNRSEEACPKDVDWNSGNILQLKEKVTGHLRWFFKENYAKSCITSRE